MTVADDMWKSEIISVALQDFGVTRNRQKVKEFIYIAADQIYETITMEIENVCPSLMFDSVSYLNTNVLSGSIRYKKDTRKLHDRTLGMLSMDGNLEMFWQII